jgi:hypothetical protein
VSACKERGKSADGAYAAHSPSPPHLQVVSLEHCARVLQSSQRAEPLPHKHEDLVATSTTRHQGLSHGGEARVLTVAAIRQHLCWSGRVRGRGGE